MTSIDALYTEDELQHIVSSWAELKRAATDLQHVIRRMVGVTGFDHTLVQQAQAATARAEQINDEWAAALTERRRPEPDSDSETTA